MDPRRTGQVRECARYQVDGRGARVRCSFEDVSGASRERQRLLVNGTAQGSPVPCSELIVALPEVGE
ncbi:hypothetical protein J0S82_017099 [Galemys pyrenaicus]|uniref:Uncharacterized protein n=1 Tax=Galemys pyrenaicus TaxID=202257 RepID=A0A8J6AGK9_GALPY|nr:hypothetical protein J0S82_017099 [Galemys pyrenaicus]